MRFDISYVELPISNERLLTSVVQTSIMKLKPISGYLKYVYLGEKEIPLVNIAKDLTQVQTDKFIWVLRNYKMVIG